jgi:hypothetical protein
VLPGVVVFGAVVLALLGWAGVRVLRALADRSGLREFQAGNSEWERLAAVRSYAAWVRYPPEPPVRPARPPSEIPVPVIPPLGGRSVPFPGRRMVGG